MLIVICLSFAVSQSPVATAPHSEIDEIVVAIRRTFDQINAQQPHLQRVERVVLELSTEGASIVAYRDQNAIVKITVEALGERGKHLFEYYFDQGQLIFRFDQAIDYGAHIMDTLHGVTLKNRVVDENRLYFSRGKLVRWLKFKKVVSAQSKEFAETEKTSQKEAASMVALMSSVDSSTVTGE